MKVVERKDPRAHWAHVFVCTKCGSSCEAEFSDIEHTPSFGCNERDYQHECFFIKCGACGQQNPTPTLSEYEKELAREKAQRRREISPAPRGKK